MCGTLLQRVTHAGLTRRLTRSHNLSTTAHRTFSTIQRGHDKQVASLFARLGFGKDKEAMQVRRSLKELEQGFVQQVQRLRDPINDPADAARLTELKEAYLLLRDENFRRNYAAHYANSNDAQLHVLVDGGAVAENFNPEHQSFEYIDHTLLRRGGSSSDWGKSTSSRCVSTPAEVAKVSFASTDTAFRSATGLPSPATSNSSSSSAHVNDAAARTEPQPGGDVSFLLKLRFEEGLLGCHRALLVHRSMACPACDSTGCDCGSNRKCSNRGSSSTHTAQRRNCPQCLGRGSVHLPSATYHIERKCAHCGGEGTMPPPPCRRCRGRGVLLDQPHTIAVTVPAGSFSGTVFRLAGKGHDGVRGGRAGDLVITVMTSEHRYFHRVGADLHAVLPLALSTALLGGVVSVPTLRTPTPRGSHTAPAFTALRVPPCVGNGTILSLRTHEMRASSSSLSQEDKDERSGTVPTGASAANEGEIFFHVLVLIPRAEGLSGRQRAALAEYDMSAKPQAHAETVSTESETSQGCAADQDRRRAQCAQLKTQYAAWFTS